MLHLCSLDFPWPIWADFPFWLIVFSFRALLAFWWWLWWRSSWEWSLTLAAIFPQGWAVDGVIYRNPELVLEQKAPILICVSHHPSAGDLWWRKLLWVVSVQNLEEGSNTWFLTHNEPFYWFTTTSQEPLLYLTYSSTRCRFSVLKQNLKMKTMQGVIYSLCYHWAEKWGPEEMNLVSTNTPLLLFTFHELHQIDFA